MTFFLSYPLNAIWNFVLYFYFSFTFVLPFGVYYVPLAYFRAIITRLALWLPQRLLLFTIIITLFLLFSLLLCYS